ncbi:MAG: Stk1 family PASTA domain-containing Ser/Thr kinase [Clostridia bacterium]|nr:Stk1 family PASTA domain-containing Ser/Thr kinase [Clostridia bacterium]
MIGRQLGNRYEILEKLGGGGMGIVYKARDVFLNRFIAIKVLRPEFSSDEDFTRRFRREAQAVASLSHPNIIAIHDVGQEDEIHYLVMEYVEGEDLKTLIRREGALSQDKAVETAVQILAALEHAHGNNIVHRDVKSQNIMITKNGQAKLMDFGIAREFTAATVTMTDTVLGSVHYLSPEQVKGEPGSPASDIYSLGVVLYEMLTGRVPFRDESAIALALKHVQENPEPPSKYNPALPPTMDQMVLRAMSKNPHDRFSSAGEMSLLLRSGGLGIEDDMATRVIHPVRDFQDIRDPVEDFEEVGAAPAEKIIEPKAASGKRRAARRVALAALVMLLFFGGLIGLYHFFSQSLHAGEVEVPDVTGMHVTEAKDLLTSQYDLQVNVNRENHPDIPVDLVIEQDITPGTKVKRNSLVTLTVSTGPDLRSVPNLHQLTLAEARDRLEEQGLVLAEPVKNEYSDTVPEGYVFRQNPASGDKVPKGSEVNIYISKGPKPGSVVPDLIGLTLEKAQKELEKNNLQLGAVEWVDNKEHGRGIVIDQEPKAGTMIREDTPIKLILSKGQAEPSPEDEASDVKVKVNVPKDDEDHHVEITVTDIRGTNSVYSNTIPSGEKAEVVVRFYGREGTVKAYIDGKLEKEKVFKASR